jgi:hypothetical protein
VRARGLVWLVSALATGLALAGCGSDSGSADSPTTTAPAAARPEVTITAHDYSFDLPAQIPAGYVDVTIDNEGKEDHQAQLVKLGSLSFDEFEASDDITKVPADTVFVGGPNGATAGRSTTATVKLDPGKYAVVCFIPSPKDGKTHEAKGMVKQVEVVEREDSVETAPVADSTIELSEFTFVVPDDFDGRGVVDVTNVGNQIHELVMVKLNDGKTATDAAKFFAAPNGAPPFSAIPGVGGIVGLSSKQHAWLTMDLDPGNYALLCFFPDPAKDGTPHVLEGMLKEITVS